MTATTAPVTTGGIKRSIHPVPTAITTSPISVYSTPQAMMPPSALPMLGLPPEPVYPVAAITTPMNAKLEPR